MKATVSLLLGTMALSLALPLVLLSGEPEDNLLKQKKDAEAIIGKILYEPKYFNKKYYSIDNFGTAAASIYLIGRLELHQYADKLEEICLRLENDYFGQAMSLQMWDSLTRLGKKGYLDKQIKIALSSQGLHKIEAAHVLIDYAREQALLILRNSVYGKAIEDITCAVEELAQINDPLAYHYLSDGLDYPDKQIQFQCAMTLTRGKWNDGEKLLKYYLKSGNTEEKKRAASGLSRLGNENGVKYVISMLNSRDPKDQYYATITLGSLGNEIARVPLEMFIGRNDVEDATLISALRALGNVGSTKSIAAINKLVNSNNRLISIGAASALIQVIDRKKIEMIAPYLLVAW